MAKRLIAGIVFAAFLLSPIRGDTPTTTLIGTPPQPAWSQLTPKQHAILAPLAGDWDKMEFYRRKKWLGIADRYAKMTPNEQRRVQERMREWAAMTPEQRAKVRDSYKGFKRLPPEKKQVVKEKWETYSKLPEEEKARIKQNKAAKLAAPDGAPAVTQQSPATSAADQPIPTTPAADLPAALTSSPAPAASEPPKP